MDFSGLTDEALEDLIRDARNTLSERRRGVSPRTLPALLDPESPNFMGLGMSAYELVATGTIERHIRSFGQQPREEQRRRLWLVIRLGAELTEIMKQTRFCSALAAAAIQDVIEGDWVAVKNWISQFLFEDEGPVCREWALPIYEKFRATLQESLNGVPRPGSPARISN